MTTTQDLVQGFAGEQQRLLVEVRELDLLIESTKTEVDRLKAREDQARARIDEARADPTRATPEEVFAAADEHSTAIARRMTMDGQLGQLQAKRKLQGLRDRGVIHTSGCLKTPLEQLQGFLIGRA